MTGTVHFSAPTIALPDLQTRSWRYINSLPEVSRGYDDNHWTSCDYTDSNNLRNLSTPTSLYAGDYGYNTGSLLYRGHFISTGTESAIHLLLEGGYAFGYTVWLNSTYLGSWADSPADMFYNQTLPFPKELLQPGLPYVVNVLIDHMGLDENFPANVQIMKDPRGILDYDLQGRAKSAISWKMTGNFGGEQYADISRGPLNEGQYTQNDKATIFQVHQYLSGSRGRHFQISLRLMLGFSQPLSIFKYQLATTYRSALCLATARHRELQGYFMRRSMLMDGSLGNTVCLKSPMLHETIDAHP